MKTQLARLLLVWAVLLTAVILRAEDLNAVKNRMNQRLPVLDTLRAQGAIGENNRGFTEVRQATGNAASVSSAENSDRSSVYSAIASQTGSTSDQVGRQRARQIAASSAAGVWIQRENGQWYRK